MYHNGWTQRDIARAIAVADSTVSEDINALIAGWQKQAGIDMSAHIAVELQRINARERRAMEHFEKSCNPKTMADGGKSVHQVLDSNDNVRTLTDTQAAGTKISREEGDPKWLMIAAKCTDQRMKLLGLDAKRLDKANAKGKTVITMEDFVASVFSIREREANEINVTSKPNQLPHAPVGLVGKLP